MFHNLRQEALLKSVRYLSVALTDTRLAEKRIEQQSRLFESVPSLQYSNLQTHWNLPRADYESAFGTACSSVQIK